MVYLPGLPYVRTLIFTLGFVAVAAIFREVIKWRSTGVYPGPERERLGPEACPAVVLLYQSFIL
jgi:hypothetical protein